MHLHIRPIADCLSYIWIKTELLNGIVLLKNELRLLMTVDICHFCCLIKIIVNIINIVNYT